MQRGVNKRWFFACALVLLIVGVVAYNSNPANPAVFGHSAGEVEVTVNGTVMTLQQAITQNLLGRDASNIIFIIPLELFSGTSAKAWTTYDLSSVVPIGTSALILESEFAVSGPNDGGATPAYVKMRKNSSSSVYLLARGQAWGAGDGVADSAQGFFPITTDRKIDYFIGPNGFDGQATIRIIGYVLGSSGGGTGGSTPEPEYVVSCAAGSSGLNFPFCCRMNTLTGVTECKITESLSGGWVGASTPFAPAPSARYSLTCSMGISGLNFPFCCRTNTLTGAVQQCSKSVDNRLTNWQGFPAPF